MEATKGKMNDKTVKLLASAGLLLVTIVWGSAFVVMKNSMDVIKPTYLLAYRFTIATAGLILIFRKQVKSMTWADIKCGALLGIFLFISYYFQTYGLKFTTASKNAFITTLYVIIVPFLHWFFNKVKPSGNNITAACIAVVGLALLSLKGDLTVNFGDFLTFICGFCFALHMVFIDRYTMCYSPIKLTVVQMASCAVFAWLVAAVFEGPCDLSAFTDREPSYPSCTLASYQVCSVFSFRRWGRRISAQAPHRYCCRLNLYSALSSPSSSCRSRLRPGCCWDAP